MLEFIVLTILTLAVVGFAAIIYVFSQKQSQVLQEYVKNANESFAEQTGKIAEMMMAGSYQEWERIKQGKKPIPNKIKNEPNLLDLTEENRIPWSEITGVKVDDGPAKPIKILI